MAKFYQLPKLSYGYQSLEPYISERQLKIHHQKHHQGYVNGANSILEKLEKSRKEGTTLDMKATLKELSFNIGGHILHSLFWKNITSAKKGGGGKPKGTLAKTLKSEFGSFRGFRQEFSQTALTVEGSGWGALAYCQKTKRPLIMQIEKHNLHLYPNFRILLVLDTWEHAYYLDYQNERAKFVDAFWNLVNWQEVSRRLTMRGKR